MIADRPTLPVTPADAGVHRRPWIPASAGMTR